MSPRHNYLVPRTTKYESWRQRPQHTVLYAKRPLESCGVDCPLFLVFTFAKNLATVVIPVYGVIGIPHGNLKSMNQRY